MYDYHVHSNHSADCKATMREMVAAAARAGLAEIALTDHLDIDYPSWEEPFSRVDPAAYLRELEEVRAEFPNVRVRSGFEFGDTPGSREKLREIAEGNALDFLLLSCHVVYGRDPYWSRAQYFEFYPTRQAAYDAYLDAALETARAWESTGYSSFAHLGYICKAARARGAYAEHERQIVYEDHPERIDAILRSVVAAGAALEVNTSGYRFFGDAIPSLRILRRYAELGGEIVTMGSDAHAPGDVARHLNTGRALALEAGIRWTAVFEGRGRKVVAL